MDSIAKAVSDPSWWFTVIIVGLVVAVVGGLLKDGLRTAIRQLIARYRQGKEVRTRTDQQYVDFLAAHPHLLQIEFTKIGTDWSYLVGLMVLFLGLPAFAVALQTNPDFHVFRLHLVNERALARLTGVLLPIIWAALGLLAWRNHQCDRLLRRAHEKYEREKHDAYDDATGRK